MAEPVMKAAGLSVGVTDHHDKNLTRCDSAIASAREVAEALDPKLGRAVRVIANPASNDLLFSDLQKAVREAKGGAFFFYFAGHALRRGDDMLLAVVDSEVDGPRGCVPLSDVLDIVRRGQVARALVILNVDQPPSPTRVRFGEGVTVLGSSRLHDPKTADPLMRAYADAVLRGLRRPALDLLPHLEDGRLDADGLARVIASVAPKTTKPEVFATGGEPLVLRDLRAELTPETTAAAKAAGEAAQAAAEAAKAERAEAAKAAESAAAAEKAAAQKKLEADKKAAADTAAAHKAAAEKKAEADKKAAADTAAAHKAAVERKADAEKRAAAERAAAEKAAAERAAAEEAAAEKAAAARTAADEDRANDASMAVNDAQPEAMASREETASVSERAPRAITVAKPNDALARAASTNRAIYVLVAAILFAVLAQYLMSR